MSKSKSDSEQDLSKTFVMLGNIIRKKGLKETVKYLSEANQDLSSDKLSEIIMNLVCEHYSIHYNTFCKMGHKRGEYTGARKLCMVLIQKYIPSLTQLEIARYFSSTDNTNVSKAIKWFDGLNPNIKIEKQYIDDYNILYEKVGLVIQENI